MFALFSRQSGFLQLVRVDFFLIRTSRFIPHASKCHSGRSFLLPGRCLVLFPRVSLFLTRFSYLILLPLYSYSFLRSISICRSYTFTQFSCHISLMIIFYLRCVHSLFLRPSFLAVLSIYIVFAFSRGSSPFCHICSRVGYYFPIVPTSCSTYDDGTQLHYRQQL